MSPYLFSWCKTDEVHHISENAIFIELNNNIYFFLCCIHVVKEVVSFLVLGQLMRAVHKLKRAQAIANQHDEML